MKSLKAQLILSSMLLVLVPLLFSNSLSYYFFSNHIEDSTESQALSTAHNIADQVSAFVDKSYTLNEVLSKSSDITSVDPVRQQKLLLDTAKDYPFIDLLYVQGTDGMQTAKTRGKPGDRSNRWWFKKFMEEKQPFVSKSYYSISTGVTVTSIFHAVEKDSQIAGIMATDLNLASIQEMIEQKFANPALQATVIDSEGVVIAHPDKLQVSEMYNYKTGKKTILKKDNNGQALKDKDGNELTEELDIQLPTEVNSVVQEALAGKNGTIEYTDLDGREVLSAYYPVKLPGEGSQSWMVIATVDKSIAMAQLKELQLKNLGMVILVLIIVVALVYYISIRITKPIVEMEKKIVNVSGGNLKETLDGIQTSSKELNSLKKNMDEMISHTAQLVGSIQNKSAQLRQASDHLTNTSEEILQSTDQITHAIQEVASGSSTQMISFTETAKAMEEMAQGIQRVTESAMSAARSSSMVTEDAKRGESTIQKAIQQMDQISEAVGESSVVVKQLGEKSQEIGNIIEVITSIANQTNLLALNAAIEAARAGEQGKGFAVVADEVRKLAEQSKQSADQIANLIQEIQQYTGRAVQVMETGTKEVEHGTNVVQEAGSTFQRILGAVQMVADQIQEVSAATQQMSASSEEISATMDEMLTITREVSCKTNDVSHSSTTQVERMQQITNSAVALNHLAHELQDEIKKFTV
ncbi:methyl-accepting chemotaxis protein [Brevibacillus sp. SYSU BS000544]|uniref:methyl-accepting chemotaxis protein n=1 Tax=Brevibacillus sp. SYSU BS000544 TaxID=3416443 RepID=UPI003CE5BE96